MESAFRTVLFGTATKHTHILPGVNPLLHTFLFFKCRLGFLALVDGGVFKLAIFLTLG